MCVEQTSSWDLGPLGLLGGAARLFTATLTSSYMPHSVAHVASTEQRRGDFMIAMTLVSFHICEKILTLWPSGWQSFCSWWNFYFSSTQRNKKLLLAMLGCAGCGPLPTPHVRIGKCYPRTPWICDSNHAKMASCMRLKNIRPGTRNGTRMWGLHSTGHQHWWIGYHFNVCRRPTEGCHVMLKLKVKMIQNKKEYSKVPRHVSLAASDTDRSVRLVQLLLGGAMFARDKAPKSAQDW